MANINHHCSVIAIKNQTIENGILIKGKSGAGKTSLALGLIEAFKNDGFGAALVSDDQALLKIQDGCVLASPPPLISGKVEIRGFGIASIENVESAKISLIVELIADEKIERMPEPEVKELLGITIPFLKLPIRHEAQAIRIVKAWLAEG